jgi:hypothetical protein
MEEGSRNHGSKVHARRQAGATHSNGHGEASADSAFGALRASVLRFESSSRRLLHVAIRELRNTAADAVEGASAAIAQLKHKNATTSEH